ncbi:MAG: hypothetical protein J6P13_02625, partial [Kiritimatiellae bacterium]|nr:hypothetical protein [Kiritimatiellia bacterium]
MAAAPAAHGGFTSSETIDGGDAGATLENNKVYIVSSDASLSWHTYNNALNVASGATTVLYIKKGATLTVKGGDANGTSSAGAGIYVPSGATLVVTGGGKLVAAGGNGYNGGNGGNGSSGNFRSGLDYWTAGSGGSGG